MFGVRVVLLKIKQQKGDFNKLVYYKIIMFIFI